MLKYPTFVMNFWEFFSYFHWQDKSKIIITVHFSVRTNLFSLEALLIKKGKTGPWFLQLWQNWTMILCWFTCLYLKLFYQFCKSKQKQLHIHETVYSFSCRRSEKQARKGFRPLSAIFVFSNSFEVLSKGKHFISGSLD